jgi:putative ABC transport system permease protein
MIENYIKIALKILMRRKLFTFISLFGISFTLTILITGAAFYDFLLNPHYPELKQDRILYVNRVHLWEKENYNVYLGEPGYYFIKKYVQSLTTPELISVYSAGNTAVISYLNNKKIKLDLRHVDANFWKILDFEFLFGRPFRLNEVETAAKVAVVSESTAKEYFGTTEDPTGKYLEADKEKFKVIGVVKDVPMVRIDSYAKVWLPLTASKKELNNASLHGDHAAMLLAGDASDVKKIKSEFQNHVKKVDFSGNEPYKNIECYAESKLTNYTRSLFGNGSGTGITIFYVILFVILVFCMLLPAINLTNINVNRILERSSEIGVRKSFGSARQTLVFQFLIENIIITLIGSVFAFVFSVSILQIIESSGMIPYGDFTINFRIFFYGILISLLFGMFSGVLPALRMSRLQIVEAFRGGVS